VKVLFFDCFSGISGDMALGAFIDAGIDPDDISRTLAALPVEPWTLETQHVDTHGIRAVRATVRTEPSGVIRTYAGIRAMLDDAPLPDDARSLAQRIFRRLAEAEARVHGRDVEQVAFHEVGAVDSIVDISGVALAMSLLGIDRAFSSAVPTGLGMVKTDHGSTPIPAPAVVELLRGAPMYSGGVPMELVTPTGAAVLATTAEGYGEIPTMAVSDVGYGAGTLRRDFPNVLRVLIGNEADRPPTTWTSPAPSSAGGVGEVVLETNVDDLSPELAAHVIEQLLAEGARDAWLTPIVMKKGRPAVTIAILCDPDRAERLRRLLFHETGTLGVRSHAVQKHALEREWVDVDTSAGTVRVKIGWLDGRPVSVAPEYEDCARIARQTSVPVRNIYEEAVQLTGVALRPSPDDIA